MKRHLVALALASAMGTSALAQLVHVSFNGTVTSKFEGENWWNGSGSGEDQPAQLQLFYDSDLHAQPSDPWSTTRTYLSNSVKNNFWRLQYGTLDISAPIEGIEVSETGFSIYAFRQSDFSTLDLNVAIAEPWLGFALPIPPFPALASPDPELPWVTHPSSFVFDTAGSANLDEGSIFVGIDRVRSEDVERFQAVPESSAYGFSAVAALGAAALWRRRAPVRAKRPG